MSKYHGPSRTTSLQISKRFPAKMYQIFERLFLRLKGKIDTKQNKRVGHAAAFKKIQIFFGLTTCNQRQTCSELIVFLCRETI